MSKKVKKQTRLASWTSLTRVNTRSDLTETVRLSSNSALSSVGASILTRYLSASQASSCPDWASFAARFTEYRVLALRIHYFPAFPDANPTTAAFAAPTTAVTHGVLAVGTDRSAALAAPASFGAVSQLAAVKYHWTARPWVYEARAIDFEDQQFTPVTTTTNYFSVQVASRGTLNSGTTYGDICVEAMVQFKGRQ